MNSFELSSAAQSFFTAFRYLYGITNIGGRSIDSDKSRSHYEVMFVLRDAGAISMTEIARLLFLSKPYMTNLIDKLEKDGFVERQPDKRDRRIINIALTHEGRRAIEEHRALLEENIGKIISRLPDNDLSELSQITLRLKDILSKLDIRGE